MNEFCSVLVLHLEGFCMQYWSWSCLEGAVLTFTESRNNVKQWRYLEILIFIKSFSSSFIQDVSFFLYIDLKLGQAVVKIKKIDPDFIHWNKWWT